MYTLEFENVTKRYGHEVVVDDLTFTVQPGRVTGFLGPNGAGKSTAMKILLDLAKADHGRATIGGTRYREMADPARNVGVVLEPNAFHPGRSGRNHLRILADGAGIDPARIAEMLEAVGLDPRGGPARRRLLPRDATAPRAGGRPARRPTGPGARRARQRARPARHPLAARPASRTRCRRRHGVRLQPPAGRGRAPRRRDRGPEPRPARHHRHARRAAAGRHVGPHRGSRRADPAPQGGRRQRPHRHRGRARRPRRRHRRDRRPSLRRGNRPARTESPGRLPRGAVPGLDEHRQPPHHQRH